MREFEDFSSPSGLPVRVIGACVFMSAPKSATRGLSALREFRADDLAFERIVNVPSAPRDATIQASADHPRGRDSLMAATRAVIPPTD